MRHIHADVLHAYAEGEEIQARYGDGDWINIGFLTHPEHEYRIKPKKVKKEGWLNIYSVYGSYTTKELADRHAGPYRKACVRIEWEEEE